MKKWILSASLIAIGGAALAHSWGTGKAPVIVQPTAATGKTPPVAGENDPVRKGQRFPESTVYVDGVAKAILRAAELPPGLVTHPIKNKWGDDPHYIVTEYLTAIGVDVKKVKAVHLYGGSRAVVVDGEDLRKHGQDLGFAFTLGDRGKVGLHIPGELHTNTTIDLMTHLAVYVDKEPPTLHSGEWGTFLTFGDGKRIEGIPYSAGEQLKGTRIYVDGKLVSTLKRRLLPDSIVVGEAGSAPGGTTFSLAGYLDSVGASASQVKAVDLLSDDDLVERIEGDDWTSRKAKLVFTIPQHSKGQMGVELPRLNFAKARISAVQLFVHLTPPKRWLAPPEVVALAGTSGGADSPESESAPAHEARPATTLASAQQSP